LKIYRIPKIADETYMKEYFNIEVLKNIYLEDSYVLEIIEQSDKILFKVDFVLCESHPYYKTPQINERYCYRHGEIIFSEIVEIRWIEKNTENYSYDANNLKDLGNIDSFFYEGNKFFLEGSWGEVIIKSDTIQLVLH